MRSGNLTNKCVQNKADILPEPSPRPSKFEIYNQFVDHGQAHLSKLGCGRAVALWFTLWRFENAESGLAFPSLATLAESMGADKRNVARMLAQLEQHGYVVTVEAGRRGRPGKNGGGKAAVYQLTLPGKGVTTTPIQSEKGVTTTPIRDPEKVSPEHGKGVTTTPEQKVTEKKEYIAAGAAGEPPEKKPRRANPLFDAIASATGADPVVNGAHIGKVAALLAKANPPYTPEDVQAFGRRWRELLPWAKPTEHPRLTIGILEKHISAIRTAPPEQPPTRPKTASEVLAGYEQFFAAGCFDPTPVPRPRDKPATKGPSISEMAAQYRDGVTSP